MTTPEITFSQVTNQKGFPSFNAPVLDAGLEYLISYNPAGWFELKVVSTKTKWYMMRKVYAREAVNSGSFDSPAEAVEDAALRAYIYIEYCKERNMRSEVLNEYVGEYK